MRTSHPTVASFKGCLCPSLRRSGRRLKRGLILPVALEECYPLEWWNHADQQGWLEDREQSSILPEATTKRLVNGETSFEQLADGLDGKMMIAKLVASGSKVAWASWVAKKSNKMT